MFGVAPVYGAAPTRHFRQNRWCVTPLGLGTTSRLKRSSNSSGVSHSRRPDPNSIGETAMCIVSTRSDRKSVVEGKSVSVSVDLGGRRLITKKKRKPERMRIKIHK